VRTIRSGKPSGCASRDHSRKRGFRTSTHERPGGERARHVRPRGGQGPSAEIAAGCAGGHSRGHGECEFVEEGRIGPNQVKRDRSPRAVDDDSAREVAVARPPLASARTDDPRVLTGEVGVPGPQVRPIPRRMSSAERVRRSSSGCRRGAGTCRSGHRRRAGGSQSPDRGRARPRRARRRGGTSRARRWSGSAAATGSLPRSSSGRPSWNAVRRKREPQRAAAMARAPRKNGHPGITTHGRDGRRLVARLDRAN